MSSRRGRSDDDRVHHLPDMTFEGPVLDVPPPPEDLGYAEADDYRNLQLLVVNGLATDDDGVVGALGSQHGILRAAAARTAGSRGIQAAVPTLQELAGTGEDQPRVEAAYALVRLGEDDAVAVLREAARGPLGADLHPVLAAGHLARLGDPRGYDIVATGLGSDFLGTRMLACKQLFAFMPLNGETSESGTPVDTLALFARALDDPEPSIQGEALVQLAAVGSPLSRPLLEAYLEEPRADYLQEAATEALAASA